jgi:hypothetical protein
VAHKNRGKVNPVIPLPILLAFLNAVWGLGVMGVAKFNGNFALIALL